MKSRKNNYRIKKILYSTIFIGALTIRAPELNVYLINAMQDNNEKLALAIASAATDDLFYENPGVIAAVENLSGYADDDIATFKKNVAKIKAGAGAGNAAAVAKEKQALEALKKDIEMLVKDSKIPLKQINSPDEAKKELVSFFEKDKGIGDKLLKEIGATDKERETIKNSISAITYKSK